MSKRVRRSVIALTVIAAAGLTACGGGGGSRPTVEVPSGVRTVAASAGSDVSEGNYEALSAPVVRALLSTATDELLGLSASGEQPTALRATAAPRTPVAWAWAVLRQVGARSGRELAQTVHTETAACPGGGTMTISWDDADDNEKISAGDVLTTSFAACVAEPAQPPVDGSFRMDLNIVELDAFDEPTAIDANLVFTRFAVSGYGSMDGPVRLWTQSSSGLDLMRISYQGTVVVEQGESRVYNLDLYGRDDGVTHTFDLSGGIGIGGQTFAIVPVTSFVQASVNPPHAGVLELRDAGGDAARLTARSSTSFDLQLVRGGAVAQELAGLLWSSYTLGN